MKKSLIILALFITSIAANALESTTSPFSVKIEGLYVAPIAAHLEHSVNSTLNDEIEKICGKNPQVTELDVRTFVKQDRTTTVEVSGSVTCKVKSN